MNPEDFKYSKEHTWVSIEGESAVSGISDHAQAELGDVVFVEMPEVGNEVTQGEVYGSIESVKAVSDLTAALSGEVIAVNEELEDVPEKVNEHPCGDGWIIKIKPSNTDELDNLLSAAEYEAYLKEEA